MNKQIKYVDIEAIPLREVKAAQYALAFWIANVPFKRRPKTAIRAERRLRDVIERESKK